MSGDEVVAFSAFVSNRADPLYLFSDAAFHANCFHKHPLAEAAEALFSEVQRRFDKICNICGSPINSPDDYLGFGHLSDDPTEPAHKLNYRQFHRACLSSWNELETTRTILKKFNDSGKWEGPGLTWLLGELPQQ